MTELSQFIVTLGGAVGVLGALVAWGLRYLRRLIRAELTQAVPPLVAAEVEAVVAPIKDQLRPNGGRSTSDQVTATREDVRQLGEAVAEIAARLDDRPNK